jgi:hypothetical protein
MWRMCGSRIRRIRYQIDILDRHVVAVSVS